jgi:arylsulfatase A-like enzyme
VDQAKKEFMGRSGWIGFYLGLWAILLFLLPSCGEDPAPGPSGQPVTPPQAREKYNVVLISLDTLRADHLGSYGYGRKVSPKLDHFTRRSVRFERAYSHAPWTTPAHGSLLSSLYPTVLGFTRYPEPGKIADRVETMAEFFKAQGYKTHAVTEGGMVHAQFGFDQGFDKYFQSAKHVDHGVNEAMKWITENKDERFFFFYHTYDIHRYNPPEEYRKKFVAPGEHRLAGMEDLALKIQNFDNKEFIQSLDENDLRYIVDLYDASIAWVDRYVGLLLEVLERQDLLKKTIVVITSDHGEEFLERSRTGHGYSNYEEQIRVPMIIYHPEVTPGVRETLFRHIDLLPTLAAGLGLPRRNEWLGESLFNCIEKGDDPNARDAVFSFCECGHSPMCSLQTKRWKLIGFGNKKETYLFDLEADPKERKPVGAEFDSVRRQFSAKLEQIKEVNQKLKPCFAGEGVEAGEMPEDLLKQLRGLGYL